MVPATTATNISLGISIQTILARTSKYSSHVQRGMHRLNLLDISDIYTPDPASTFASACISPPYA